MNGVMIPKVSAGSNQIGASETCSRQVSWPCGAARATCGMLAAARPAAAPVRTVRREISGLPTSASAPASPAPRLIETPRKRTVSADRGDEHDNRDDGG